MRTKEMKSKIRRPIYLSSLLLLLLLSIVLLPPSIATAGVNTWTSSGPTLLPGGANWQTWGGIRSVILAKNASGNEEIFAGSDAGHIYRSTDRGVSWTNSLAGAGIYALASSPNYASDHTLFAASAYGYNVFKSTDSGQTWTDISRWWQNGGVPFNNHWSIAISPNYTSDQTVFLGGNYGVYRSTDGGSNWVKKSTGIAGGVVALALSPNYSTDHTMFAVGSGVYISTDGAESWIPLDSGFGSLGTELAGFLRTVKSNS